MANKDLPNGFSPAPGWPLYEPHVWPVAGSEAIAKGDVVYLNSSGYAALAAAGTTGVFLGVAASPVAATASAGDDIWVWDDPRQAFEGQCSGSGALADPYTTNSAAAAFDLEGTTGIQEINEDAASVNVWKILGVGFDPDTGLPSAIGANQRKICKINPYHHVFGITA